MDKLSASPLRNNLGKWALAIDRVPAAVAAMVSAPSLTFEKVDLGFNGQCHETTYFDTEGFALRKARDQSGKSDSRYLTLRLRFYAGDGHCNNTAWALSAKTERDKWRQQVSPDVAEMILQPGFDGWATVLPGNILARLDEVAGQEQVLPVIKVCYRRYAVEDDKDRLTLDLGVRTDLGKQLPFGVMEFKSSEPAAAFPGSLPSLGLPPVKLSKYLWATQS